LHKKCADFQITVGCELIKRGVDAIWVGDDFGSQENTLISPECFKEKIIPHYTRMIEAYRALNPDIVMILHCDGAVKKVLPEVCNVGFTVFNPVQPNVQGHSPRELKDELGARLSFFGAIDQQYLLPFGTDDELAADIKSKIEVLGEGGGYIVAPAHIIQSDVSPVRVEKFIELCYKYGRIYG
jgi:uroporphyrinogen decarboxylase